MAKRRRREYLLLLDGAKAAAETAIDAYNQVRHPYRNETTLILLTNAWELLAKAILVQSHVTIRKGQRGNTISAESAISKILHRKIINAQIAETTQQIISLRHAACHHYLPPVDDEIMQHLLFFGCKFFRETVKKQFRGHAKDLDRNFLSLSFTEMTTYADKVQRLVSKIKKSESDRTIAWLLERGIQFDGNQYITQKQFEAKYKNKKKIMPHLAIGEFLKRTDMVRVVPVEAPKNYTADVTLRKGSSRDASLPVVVSKTELESDYPYLTRELASEIGKNPQFVAKAAQRLNFKGDSKYHQAVRTGRSSETHRYSEAAKMRLINKLANEPDFWPY